VGGPAAAALVRTIRAQNALDVLTADADQE
jgi:hypothetical protein